MYGHSTCISLPQRHPCVAANYHPSRLLCPQTLPAQRINAYPSCSHRPYAWGWASDCGKAASVSRSIAAHAGTWGAHDTPQLGCCASPASPPSLAPGSLTPGKTGPHRSPCTAPCQSCLQTPMPACRPGEAAAGHARAGPAGCHSRTPTPEAELLELLGACWGGGCGECALPRCPTSCAWGWADATPGP